ncbi:MAG: hypothetical protein K8Q91_03565 [Candidatus Vogelbacteria bacterium]|nr:hypothetical protein [Candidatus Vogelbacteria bacterium]
MTKDLDIFREKFERLPEDVRGAIFAVETTDVIANIQKKFKLHVDQTGKLAEEVGLVMLGFSKPNEFVGKITKNLQVTQITAVEITKDINDKIFNPIKESLKQIHNLENSGNEPLIKTRPTDSDTIFDSKLKGLFSASTTSTNKVADPYHEGI